MPGEPRDAPRELRTARARLVAAGPGEEDELRAAIEESLPDLHPWISWATRVPDRAALERVAREARDAFDERRFFVWRVLAPDAPTVLGTVDLHHLDWSVPKGEVGYWLRSSCTGRGLAREAVAAALRAAFDDLGLERVEARCDPRNARSWRLAERLGFRLEGVARRADRDATGALCDERMYALLRGEAGSELRPGRPA